jgi:ADP-ribose pyrophosphatase YjhB (NUDIX family)
MREMITFRGEGAKFNFRVIAVIFDRAGERVLIHRGVSDPFWTLPGGRAELLESAEEGIKREMLEELEVEVKVERLLWVVENFFRYNDAQWHELAFYFLVSLPDGSPLYSQQEQFSGYEEGMELIFQWHDIAALEQVNLLPSFLRKGLQYLPPTIEYVVHTDV